MEKEFNKDKIQVTFSSYDFLGYIVPSIIFFTIIMIFETKINTLFKTNNNPFIYTPLTKFYDDFIVVNLNLTN